MICIIALVVFGVLGLFSVGYRSLAKEAFSCVFRRMTLRPCETGFDQRMKAKVVSKILSRSHRAARFVNNHFEALSWIFTIAMFASLGYSAYSLYNLATLGTCDPVSGQCPFGTIRVNATNATACAITADFVEFYGRECPHCRAMEPVVAQVERETGIVFQKLEVWDDKQNYDTMMMHSQDILRDCPYPNGELSVPTFYNKKNGKAACGEMSLELLKQFVLENK
jgi:thiol-disulfide isomerase/thioredoxin